MAVFSTLIQQNKTKLLRAHLPRTRFTAHYWDRWQSDPRSGPLCLFLKKTARASFGQTHANLCPVGLFYRRLGGQEYLGRFINNIVIAELIGQFNRILGQIVGKLFNNAHRITVCFRSDDVSHRWSHGQSLDPCAALQRSGQRHQFPYA
jgi:hypothetical protein